MLKKMKELIKKNYKIIILLICVAILFAIIEDLFDKETMSTDLLIHELIVENMRNETFTRIFKVITNFGGAYCLIAIAIFLTFYIKNKKIAFSIPLNLVIITILNILLKNIVERPRPIGYRLIDESGYSFPSGHSMISVAFYGLLIYHIWKNCKNIKLRNISCILLSILVFLIGVSRIYLGVHYATDVIGGFVISIIYLMLFTSVYKNLKVGKE